MSLPTGRQLLLFACLQLVVLWGVALLLARGVEPLHQEGVQEPLVVEREVADTTRATLPHAAYAQGPEFGLSPAFWQRAAGAREKQRRAERRGRWRANLVWIPGPTGSIPLPVFEKVCRPKAEPAGPRS